MYGTMQWSTASQTQIFLPNYPCSHHVWSRYWWIYFFLRPCSKFTLSIQLLSPGCYIASTHIVCNSTFLISFTIRQISRSATYFLITVSFLQLLRHVLHRTMRCVFVPCAFSKQIDLVHTTSDHVNDEWTFCTTSFTMHAQH